MEGPPVEKYLFYSMLLSVLIILAIVLYQQLTLFETTTIQNISKNLKDFVITNYTYEEGVYSIRMVPTSILMLNKLLVNGKVFEEFVGTFEKSSPIILEGNASGEITIIVKYMKTGLEHTGYAVIPEN